MRYPMCAICATCGAAVLNMMIWRSPECSRDTLLLQETRMAGPRAPKTVAGCPRVFTTRGSTHIADFTRGRIKACLILPVHQSIHNMRCDRGGQHCVIFDKTCASKIQHAPSAVLSERADKKCSVAFVNEMKPKNQRQWNQKCVQHLQVHKFFSRQHFQSGHLDVRMHIRVMGGCFFSVIFGVGQ